MMGEDTPDGTGTIKHPVPWAGEAIRLTTLANVGQGVEHPLFHRDLARHAEDGRDGLHHERCPWWYFKVVPQLKVLHK
jgi:hypothetical protein